MLKVKSKLTNRVYTVEYVDTKGPQKIYICGNGKVYLPESDATVVIEGRSQLPFSILDAESSLISLFKAAIDEADTASNKYPQPNFIALKIAEEAGEVVRECVKVAQGTGTYENLALEMVQNIAMLIRLWEEGDEINGILPVKDNL